MAMNLELMSIIGLLADEDKFKILAAIALGAGTLAEIGEKTGFDHVKIVKAAARLEKAGLIERKADSGYRYLPGILTELNMALSKTMEHKPAASHLDRFIRNGRLTNFPKSQDDRLLVLEHLANLFEFDRRYTEKEVNIILNTLHPDHASFRRYLIDYGFLERNSETEDGRTTMLYWRKARS
jgi:hypothetical protein